MCRYAKEDRGYRSAALIYDTLVDDDNSDRDTFEKAIEKHGLENKGVETFTLFDTDFKPQLQRLKSERPDVLFVFGLSGNTANIVKQLDELGSAYVDTPTVLSGDGWHPHVMGSPAGTGEKSWAEQAGASAKAGTITAWVVGGLVYLPTFAMARFLEEAGQPAATGGEEVPANALFALLRGVQAAGSNDRDEVVSAIEGLRDLEFASTKFGFSEENHGAITLDDVTLVTLERGGQTPYTLGAEFGESFPADYVGPTQLVDFTLEANRDRHPEVVEALLEGKYGSSLTYQPDAASEEAFERTH
jgi:branched-chain amino acid transport system substrate-binding protein